MKREWAVMLLPVSAALFIIFGIGFLLEPVRLATFLTGGAPIKPSAVIDMRATYGGMTFGFGVFQAYSALGKRAVKEATAASALVLLGLAFGRLLGIAIDGSPNTMMYVLLVSEVLFGAFQAFALMRIRRSERRMP